MPWDAPVMHGYFLIWLPTAVLLEERLRGLRHRSLDGLGVQGDCGIKDPGHRAVFFGLVGKASESGVVEVDRRHASPRVGRGLPEFQSFPPTTRTGEGSHLKPS